MSLLGHLSSVGGGGAGGFTRHLGGGDAGGFSGGESGGDG